MTLTERKALCPLRGGLAMFTLGLLLFLAAAVAGCLAGCASPDPASVAFYQAVAPEYKGYVERDPDLTGAQKARRLRTLEVEELRLGIATPTAEAAR